MKNSNNSYASEKLGLAVRLMATTPSGMKERLLIVYLDCFQSLSEKYFPDDLKENWNVIFESLTKEKPLQHEIIGSVQKTLNNLDEKTCVEIAEKITALSTELNRRE